MKTTSEETLKRMITQIHMLGYFHFGPMKLRDRQTALSTLLSRGYLTESLRITKEGLTFASL
jgi:hypothetical protein